MAKPEQNLLYQAGKLKVTTSGDLVRFVAGDLTPGQGAELGCRLIAYAVARGAVITNSTDVDFDFGVTLMPGGVA